MTLQKLHWSLNTLPKRNHTSFLPGQSGSSICQDCIEIARICRVLQPHNHFPKKKIIQRNCLRLTTSKTDKMIELVDDLFQYYKAKEAFELS